MRNVKPLAVAIALCLSTSAASSAETRQHGTHEHGVAQLMMAIEGQQVQLMLESPMFNLAGFGQAQSEEQLHEVEEIEQLLHNPLALFEIAGAACVAASTVVAGEAFEGEHGETEQHHEEGHDEEHAKEEHHEEEAHDEDHGEEEHHDEEHEHEEESNHADVQVEWVLDCPELSGEMITRVNLFKHFEHLEQLDVQYLADEKQGAARLTAEQNELQF